MENNNKIKLCFIFNFRRKNEEIALLLYPEINVKKVVFNLCEKIKEIDELNKELNIQKLVNEKLREELSVYKKNVKDNNNYILKLNNEISQLKNKYKLLPFNLNKYQEIIFIIIIIIIFAIFICMYTLYLKIQKQFISINDNKRIMNEEINNRIMNEEINKRTMKEEINKIFNDYFKCISENEFAIKIETLKSKDLSVLNGEKEDYIKLKKDGLQYGPYRMYKPGKYLIIYIGSNLKNGKFDVYDYKLSTPSISLNIIKKEENKVIYRVDIPEHLVAGIEFRVKNTEDKDISITKIDVYEIFEKNNNI